MQSALPYDPFAPRPLPGIAPLDMADWLIVDEAYAGQMARRRHLLATRRAEVLVQEAGATGAVTELLEMVLAQLGARPQGDFTITDTAVTGPDGLRQPVDRDDPLGTLGRIAQEDFCILQKRGDAHVLTGAVLCFPASWSLSEKFRRPLIAIHDRVPDYDANIARRVQRLFDGVRAGRPLWRFNALWYEEPELFQPRSAAEPRRVGAGASDGPYLRSERQSVLRLPESGAVVFSIHTFVLPRAAVVPG